MIINKFYFFILFIILFCIYNYILWYLPHNINIRNMDDEIYFINNSDEILKYLYQNKPIITDGRKLFKHTWNNFEIPLLWIKDNIVSGEINTTEINIDNETNNSYKKTNYLSMFNEKYYKKLKYTIYNFYELPPIFDKIFSYYISDIYVNNSNFITPWLLNSQTYHIFFTVSGNIKLNILPRKFYIENKKNINIEKEFNYVNKEYNFNIVNIDEKYIQNNKKTIICKENSFIIIPYNYVYSIEYDGPSVVLSYYYKSILNNITNNYLKLKNYIIQNDKN